MTNTVSNTPASIKQLRLEKGMTQAECAAFLQIALRTYKRYEAADAGLNPIKYAYIIDKLSQYGVVDEEHGLLTIDQIKIVCKEVFAAYDVEYAYLFGSYAKGKARDASDVDILVCCPVNGLRFYELVEVLREKLHKKVDLLDAVQLSQNPTLVQEILRDGVKIYG